MSQPVTVVEGLGKSYRLGAKLRVRPTLRESLVSAVASCFQNGRAASRNGKGGETFWALKNVSFDVERGEMVGLIGRNGAGKSTLLKILSRITEPTEGTARIRGRLASLLEVGTGFHPELTGRENVYLNGSILGMTKAEIDRKFDEIVAFAEVERFLDTQVKYYSSGMYVRLAFAVAAHLEPEILVVDEVLAVGDASFQKKCLGRMEDVTKEGRTVLFVSHNTAAIASLCSRVILLEGGQIEFDGSVQDGLLRYMDNVGSETGGDMDLSSHPSRRATCQPLLTRVRLLSGAGGARNRFFSGEPMTIELTYDPVLPLADPQFGIGVDDWLGTRIFSLATYLSDSVLPPFSERSRVTCSVDALNLAPGHYVLSLSAGTIGDTLVDNLVHAISFDVEAGDFYGNGRVAGRDLGIVHVRSRWAKLDS
jgi:lipopolysaccharide transport system ATP-binding protein